MLGATCCQRAVPVNIHNNHGKTKSAYKQLIDTLCTFLTFSKCIYLLRERSRSREGLMSWVETRATFIIISPLIKKLLGSKATLSHCDNLHQLQAFALTMNILYDVAGWGGGCSFSLFLNRHCFITLLKCWDVFAYLLLEQKCTDVILE